MAEGCVALTVEKVGVARLKRFSLGHMGQLFHPQGWDFHLKTVAAFGTAVRLRGFLGVRQLNVSMADTHKETTY